MPQWKIQSASNMNMAPGLVGDRAGGRRRGVAISAKMLCTLTDLYKDILEISSRSRNRMQLYSFPVSILPFALAYSTHSKSFTWKYVNVCIHTVE